MKRGLRNSRLHRLMGDRLFHSRIWSFDRKSLAGGLALGLFIAFTPTIPFQMLLAVVGALLLGVNVCIAVAAVYVTNPVTAIPIYLVAIRVGRFLCTHTGLTEFMTTIFEFEGRMGKVMRESLFLWTGCLLFSVISAILGYAAVHLAWSAYHWRKGKKRFKEQA